VVVAEKTAVVRRRPFGFARFHSPMAEKQLEQAVPQTLRPVEYRGAAKASSKQQLDAELKAMIWLMRPFSREPRLLAPSSAEIDVAWNETMGAVSNAAPARQHGSASSWEGWGQSGRRRA
jgi:hypothetical protein